MARIFKKTFNFKIWSVISLSFLFSLVTFAQDYYDPEGLGRSNLNNRNINFPYPEDGTNLQDLKRSSGAFTVYQEAEDNIDLCSFTLLNTVNQDGAKYISTAAHCLKGYAVGDIKETGFTLDFEMANATRRGTPLQDENISGFYIANFEVLLKDVTSDLALIKLTPPNDKSPNFSKLFKNAYASGWDNTLTEEIWSNISHPWGDHKKAFINPTNSELQFSTLSMTTGVINKGFFNIINSPWNGIDTNVEGGSSGSGFFDKKNLMTAVMSSIPVNNNNIANASHLSNNWYGLPSDQSFYMNYLDPNGTWLNSIPGGYLNDLIQVDQNEKFEYELEAGEILETKGTFEGNQSTLHQDVLYVKPSVLFNYNNKVSLNDESKIWQEILGIKSEDVSNEGLVLSVYFLDQEPSTGIYSEKLIFGSHAHHTSPLNSPVEFEFKGESYDCNNPPPGHPACTNIITPLNYPNIGGDFKIKSNYVATINRMEHNLNINLMSNTKIPIRVKLANLENQPIKVQAISYPGDVPRNVLQLFNPERVTGSFKYYRYRDHKYNSNNLSINSITLKNWDKPEGVRTDTEPIVTKTIETGNNGGYLNLVNPNYSFSPVELSWEDPNDATNSKDRFIELEIKLNKQNTVPISFSVWIDYFNRDSFLGRNVSDKTYNFVFDEIQNHPSELLVSSANIDANTTISHPDDQTILINAKLPPIGIGPNNSLVGKKRLRIAVIEGPTPPAQDLVDNTLAGEVEDYLIDLVPPSDALNIDKQLAEMLKNTANIRHKKRKKSGDQDPACNQGDETGEQMYDETGLDNSPFQRTCSIWEGPCVSGDTCHALYQLDNNAEGGELVSLSGNNFVEVDRTGVYTRGDFENGFTALTTYSPSNPYCETCDSEYILKQGSIQGDNDGDGGGDGDGDGWGLRLNPDAEDPVIELEVDVNNQQEIISVPLKEWLAQDPNQKFDIMVKKEQREIALMVRSRYTNTYDEEEVMLNTSVMNITQITTLGGGVSQVHNNTSGKIYDFMFNNTPTTNEEDKIIFENATETTITYNKSNSTVGKDNNINTTKLNTETEDQPDFSLYPNPAKDKINILVEVRQEGPLYIDIFDMNGRQVYSINRPNITQGHQLINLPIQNLSAGNYILKIRAGDVVRSEKVVVE